MGNCCKADKNSRFYKDDDENGNTVEESELTPNDAFYDNDGNCFVWDDQEKFGFTNLLTEHHYTIDETTPTLFWDDDDPAVCLDLGKETSVMVCTGEKGEKSFSPYSKYCAKSSASDAQPTQTNFAGQQQDYSQFQLAYPANRYSGQEQQYPAEDFSKRPQLYPPRRPFHQRHQPPHQQQAYPPNALGRQRPAYPPIQFKVQQQNTPYGRYQNYNRESQTIDGYEQQKMAAADGYQSYGRDQGGTDDYGNYGPDEGDGYDEESREWSKGDRKTKTSKDTTKKRKEPRQGPSPRRATTGRESPKARPCRPAVQRDISRLTPPKGHRPKRSPPPGRRKPRKSKDGKRRK